LKIEPSFGYFKNILIIVSS